MIELGEMQRLSVVKKTSLGLYLGCKKDNDKDVVLLPISQCPKELKIGDEVEVFVYRNSEDKMIATLKTPKLTLGDLALLKVVEITDIGAFLDWGLEKDLFLPFKEQKFRVKKDDMCLVALYIDRSDRLCATMDIYELLSIESPYKEKDKIIGTIYNIHEEFGAFVAVENKYHGLIPKKELYGNHRYGDVVEARVKKIREDGKLELSIRQEAYNEIDGDAEKILDRLKHNDGTLLLNDNSQPSFIKQELEMSKAAFKRAVGRLLKNRIIIITENGIELVKK